MLLRERIAVDISTMLAMLGQGFVVTLQIFFLTLLGSLPLGVLVALGRMSRVKHLAWLMRLYISVMRGTPLMLQMFFIYFAPYYLFGMDLSTDSKFNATIVAFIIKDTVQLHAVSDAFAAGFNLFAWIAMLFAVIMTIISMIDYFVKSKAVFGYGDDANEQ